MAKSNRIVCVAMSLSLLIGMPALSHAEVDESLLQRLFRLIRFGSTYEGRLSDVIAKSTRSGNANTLTRILLVNHQTGETIEWMDGRGAVEPLVCPDGCTLVVRRGEKIERTEIKIANGQVVSMPEAETIPADIDVRQIFGCTPIAEKDATTWNLWAETKAGEIKTVQLGKGASLIGDLPKAFRSDPPGDVGRALRKLQGIRSDGLSAMVNNDRLVVKPYNDSGTNSSVLLVSMPVTGDPVPVTGDPAWLGNTDWIVVTGLKN